MYHNYIPWSLNNSRQLLVEPKSGFLMDSTMIIGQNFPTNHKVTVSGHFVCKEETFDCTSFAHISSDASGCFDLSKTQSVGGTYTGVEPMGLFWSMKPKSIKPSQFSNAARCLNYTFKVFEGHINSFDNQTPLAQSSITRSIVKNNIIRKEININGIIGTLYIPEGRGPFPAAVTIHGGVKNKHVIEDYAALLANQGFVMLALVYFGVEGFPASYSTQPIDIESFEKAIFYLQSLDEVSSDHVGVVGSSKGGEIALAMISFLPQLKFCCIFNTWFCSFGNSTVYKNQTVERFNGNENSIIFSSETLVDWSNYLDDLNKQPKALHNFTRSNADTLLVVGDKDVVFKGNNCIDLFKAEVQKSGKGNFKVSHYFSLGHLVFIPNLPIATTGFHPLLPKGIYVEYGGSDDLSGYAKDTKNLWDEVYAFMEKQKPIKSKL